MMLSSSASTKTKSRRLVSRACDNCRQRKVRCDGSNMPESNCTTCLTFGEPCTYEAQSKPRGPRTKLVDALRRKIAALELQLRTLSLCSLCSRPLQSAFTTHSSPASTSQSESEQGDDPDVLEEINQQFSHFHIAQTFFQFKPGSFGSASIVSLGRDALKIKEKYLGRRSVPNSYIGRPLYWHQSSWEKTFYGQRPTYQFPTSDLLRQLIDLYFSNIHVTLPILHRTSFERSVAENLHIRDKDFGTVLLVVLALASRYSDDTRVMIDQDPLSSGWPFMIQVQLFHSLLDPTVYAVQFYCLLSLFVLGTSTPHMTWVYMGIAIRFLQYHGRYLRKHDDLNLEDELWNRAFWSVFVVDVHLSNFMGRPPVIHMEDYDVDPVLEVDDEYWEQGFVQPQEQPSALTFFAHSIRLHEILGKALRELHASKSRKTRMGWTAEREKQTVAELDSFMNDFLDSIPPHLRWDPNGRGIFFQQAAVLHATYYCLQITVHRLYIHNQASFSEPSLFICLRAARSVLSVANTWMNKPSCTAPLSLQTSTLVAAIILLLNIFVIKRTGVSMDVEKDLSRVSTAMKLMQACETRWHAAGRSWELLHELQSLDSGPISQEQRAASESQPRFAPGTSIEQLLAETTPADWDQSLDHELMSLWLAAPMDIDQWILNAGDPVPVHPYIDRY